VANRPWRRLLFTVSSPSMNSSCQNKWETKLYVKISGKRNQHCPNGSNETNMALMAPTTFHLCILCQFGWRDHSCD
jgi:hypothetical protein